MKTFDIILQDAYTECDAFLYTLLYIDFCTFDEQLLIQEWANPVTIKKILSAETDPSLAITTQPVEPLKTSYEQGDSTVDIIVTGQETLRYYNEVDTLPLPVEVGEMNLLYRQYGAGDEKLMIQVDDMEGMLYHLFYADTERLSVETHLTEDGTVLYKNISGEATLPLGVPYRKARLEDYDGIPLQVLGTSTLEELSKVRLRTVLTMFCEVEPMVCAVSVKTVDAVATKVG